NCKELDELWMIDEKSYLIISPGKNKEQMTSLVENNLKAIENFKFIYKNDLISPKIRSVCLDRDSNSDGNILEELIKQINTNE
ncbi:hypothetical protein FSE90_08065, partial [Campylobacter novaezeelandiae]|nr:hypothetical protein [Campylobacter novaezeelandiae]